MISPVSDATSVQSAYQNDSVRKSPPPAQPQTVPQDTVHLSAAAQAAKAATQELHETPAQTATEAARGDMQAKRLLAREAADKA